MLLQDLIWSEKSPALVVIALNMITYTTLVSWLVLNLEASNKLLVLWSLVINLNLILIYAAIAQLTLFMRSQKQAFWVAGIFVALNLLSPFILNWLTFEPNIDYSSWLFTPFAWGKIQYASATTVFLTLLVQWSILTLLILQLKRQLSRVRGILAKS